MLKRLRDLFRPHERQFPLGHADGLASMDVGWSTELDQKTSLLTALLEEIEAAAMQVYAAHDMPTRPGEYARFPRAQYWQFIAEHLSPAEKWALLTEQPIEQGFHYGTLADIGARPDGPAAVQRASAVLRSATHLRRRMAERESVAFADDIRAALQLGADWEAIREAKAWQTSRLKLTAPRKGKNADRSLG